MFKTQVEPQVEGGGGAGGFTEMFWTFWWRFHGLKSAVTMATHVLMRLIFQIPIATNNNFLL